MGRASNRKKGQRRIGGPDLRRIKQNARTRAVATRPAFGLDARAQVARRRVERRSAALRAWLGDSEPVPAKMPSRPEGSLGHRLLAGTPLGEARDAPCLLTAQLPDAGTIAADFRHWPIATGALIRAAVFDGLTLHHPAVNALLETLTPVIDAEIAHMQAMDDKRNDLELFDDDDEPDFPELDSLEFPERDGPVFLLGRALVEAVWAAVGDDSLAAVSDVLELALAGVVPGLEARSIVAALLATSYTLERPAGTRPRPAVYLSDNPLELFALDGELPLADVLPAGLLVLSALARLCLTDSVSVLQRT